MNKSIIAGMLLLGLASSATVNAAGDAAAGKALYAVCATCHGENGEGNKALNSPRIAGHGEWYVVRQLQNFRGGIRGADAKDPFGPQMAPMAMTLKDDQAVEDVAAYVASLQSDKPEETVSGDAEKGKTGYTVCAACHGAKGEGNAALNAPGLTGQHDWYTVRQIKNFKDGVRGANPKDTFGAQMRPMAMTLATDEAVNDIAAYINSLD